MRLAIAIDNIANGSNAQHETIVLLCEIADMLEKMVNFTYVEPIKEVASCQENVEKVVKKRGRPFKEVKDASKTNQSRRKGKGEYP